MLLVHSYWKEEAEEWQHESYFSFTLIGKLAILEMKVQNEKCEKMNLGDNWRG